MIGIPRVSAFIALATRGIRLPVFWYCACSLLHRILRGENCYLFCNKVWIKYDSGERAYFGSEERSGKRRKDNVDVENKIFDLAVLCAHDTSSVFVWGIGVRK